MDNEKDWIERQLKAQVSHVVAAIMREGGEDVQRRCVMTVQKAKSQP